MALNLESRQRAMLQDMGITLWWPQPVPELAAPAAHPVAVPQADARVMEHQEAPRTAAPQLAREQTSPIAKEALRAPVPADTATSAAPTAAAPVAAEAKPWRIAPAVAAYPAAAEGAADEAWLVIWECPAPAEPLSGEAGKLLDNMLRALRLHHSRHVWIAGIQRPGADALPITGAVTSDVEWQPLEQGLSACVRQTRPARILVLGLHAARVILGSEEALGRLRAQVHQVQGTPAVVSYDPAYLLRSPHAKPAAWADLCRADALRPLPPAL